jgi:hypothetical protein
VVGLYKSIYGINPMYNRLYLNPHLPERLSGTELIYNFRQKKLKIGLTANTYSISDNQFKITSEGDFGFYSTLDEMQYFDGNDETCSLKVQTSETISLEILKWEDGEYTWLQSSENEKGNVTYILPVLRSVEGYTVYDGNRTIKIKSDKNGILKFQVKSGVKTISVKQA